MRDNPLRMALKEGKTVLGTIVAEFASPAIPLALADAGFDYFFIDMEHGGFDLKDAAAMSAVARLAGITPLVRVPDSLYHPIAQALDAGAMGVMAPRVETREAVEQVVAACRYPPLGARGAYPGRGNNEYRSAPLWEFARHANENVVCVIQVERKEAVERIDDLLSVPGVDAILIGPADLTLSLGAPDPGAPAVQEAIDQVVAAARRHGVTCGIHTQDASTLKEWQARGMTLLSCLTDVDFVSSGARAAVQALRS